MVAATLPESHRSTVIEPTLLCDRHGLAMWSAPLDGPVTGALMFRVGSGDELLHQRGLTHLVEHLTLSGFRDSSLQWNGFVDLNRTVFHATGPQAAVERFLAHVARRLGSIDGDVLERERSVLAAEARGTAPSVVGDLMSRRYGTSGWGASAWWELAVPDVSVPQLDEWRTRWFTRENAVVWMTAMPTQSLHVDLPTGRAMPPVEPTTLLAGRGWVRHSAAGVAMLMRHRRSHATAAAVGVIVSELHRELRERGLCYSVAGAWHRLTATTGALSIFSDVVPNRELEHAETALTIIDRLAAGVPARFMDERRVALEAATPDDVARSHLDSFSLDLLLGGERRSAARDVATERDVTPEEIQEACRHLRDDLLMALPDGVALPDVRLARLPDPVGDHLGGRPHRYRVFFDRSDSQTSVSASDTGVTIASAWSTTSVRWEDVAVVMRWHDGTRLAVDRRGVGVLVEPTRFERGDEIVAAVDALAPADRVAVVASRYAAPVGDWAPPGTLRAWAAVRLLLGYGLVLGMVLFTIRALTGSFAVPSVLGAVACAVGFVAAARLMTRRPAPFVWDNANTRTTVPEQFDRSTWYVPGGLLLGWAIRSGRLDERWAGAHARQLEQFRSGHITAPVLYRSVGGVLADDVVDVPTNEFFTDYLAQGSFGYDYDLGATFPGISIFAIPDNAHSQARADRLLDDAVGKWERWAGRSSRRHLRRFAARWSGPQSDSFGSAMVQRWRHWRWR